MKTNRLFRVVVGCLVCAAGVQVTSCTSTPDEDKQLPDKRDTTTLVDTVALPFGVERITIDAAGGDIEVVFKPAGDWTFSSATDWLKVTTASGKVADNVLKFNAGSFDQIGGAREAVTTITVGGLSKTVKFTQTGIPRFVHIYDMRLALHDKSSAKAKISNIISNVTELEIASFSPWIKSAEIIKDPKVDTQWVVNLELLRPDYDSEDRTGGVVVRDKNFPEYTFEIPVDLLATMSKYVATAHYQSKDLVARGTDAQMTHTFSISKAPETEDYSIFFRGTNVQGQINSEPLPWITCKEAAVQPKAAYGSKTYEFKMDINDNIVNWASSRNAKVLVVPKSELDANGMPIELKDTYAALTISQNNEPVIKEIDCTGKTGMYGQFVYDPIEVLCEKKVLEADPDGPGPQKEKSTIGMSEKTVVTIMVKMAKGFKPKVEIPTIAKITESVEPEFKWVGSVDFGTPVSEGGLDVYTIKITCDAADYKTVATPSVSFNLLIYTGDQPWDLTSRDQLDRGYMIPLVYVNEYTVEIPDQPDSES